MSIASTDSTPGAAPSTPAPAAPSDVEIIIDDTQAAFTGSWLVSSYQPHYYGTGYHYTDRTAYSEQARVATWTPALPAAGQYTVSVWLPDGNGDRTTAATYRVHHAGTETDFVVDQTITGGVWRQLGSIPLAFDGKGGEYVELRVADVTPNPGGGHNYVMADAVRIATPPPPLKDAPSGFAAATGRNYIELSWEALENADGYVVSRAEPGGDFVVLGPSRGTAYLDLDVDQGAELRYTVAGTNGSGPGPATKPLAAALERSVPLQAVQGITISTDSGGRPVLSWLASRDASSYLVERSGANGHGSHAIAHVTGTTFTDPHPPRGTVRYSVRSANDQGASKLSSWQVNWRSSSGN